MPENDSKITLEFLRRQVEQLSARPSVDLKGGGGGGKSDDMEARVKRLEEDSKDMRADLKAIRIDLAEIKGKLSAMPSTWQMVGFVVAIAVAMFTVIRVALPL